MTLKDISIKLLRKQDVTKENVLEILVKFYETAADFNENKLHNVGDNFECIIEDMRNLSIWISKVGLAKSLAEGVLENKLSKSDEHWRKTNLADYKQSSKSSTTHQINLRGKDENHPYSLVSKLLVNLYYDMNTKFKALQSISANLKFEIEKELLDYNIKRSINR